MVCFSDTRKQKNGKNQRINIHSAFDRLNFSK
jgi:hypothetical protein